MTPKELSTWWQKGIAKERARFSNTPKSPKRNPLFIPPEFSNFAPGLTSFKHHARKP